MRRREIRKKIFEIVSRNGGHLSSNLGVIEATLALMKVFGGKENDIVWDVGHQSYAFKILTGRLSRMETIRKKGGLSGFTNPEESDRDKFKSGHASTSISAALGLAISKLRLGKKGKVIAFIGDGAMTGGLAYEGLNNAVGVSNLIVILNDNSMSISENVGGISKYLSKIRTNNFYLNTKKVAKNVLKRFPFFGHNIKSCLSGFNLNLRKMLFKKSTLFEYMGFKYYGPVDGHNILEMTRIFKLAKDMNGPILIHIVTKKGKGYHLAESEPSKFHGVSSFDAKTGVSNSSKSSVKTFSSVFGEHLCEIARKNKKIYAITAAMADGTGLKKFSEQFPDRFSDVGIAESHAVTFAGGLSAGGLIPVFAVYSTFLQRTFDQLIHDVSMQNLKIVLCIDRAGLVGEDGESHQGIFDVSMLNAIPNLTCYSPSYFDELKYYMDVAVRDNNPGIVAIRYPKGEEPFRSSFLCNTYKNFEIYGNNKKKLIITYGRLFPIASQILENQPNGITLFKLNKMIPIDSEIINAASDYENIIFFEESYKHGSVSEQFGNMLMQKNFRGKYKNICIKNFVKHASVKEQLEFFNIALTR